MHHVRDVDIVIVGGGLAGLAAALECQRHQCSFVVLEARDRPGGRVCSVALDDGTAVDLGGQWIGPRQPRIRQLIERFGLRTAATISEGRTIYDFGGKRKFIRNGLPLTLFAQRDFARFERNVQKQIQQLEKSPLDSAFAQKLDRLTIDRFIKEQLLTREGRAFYRMIVEEIMCSKANDISALDLLWCISSTGAANALMKAEKEWIVEGAQALAERMAASLGSNLVYEAPVQRICYDDRRAYVYTAKHAFRAHRAIVAVPPNLTGRIEFVPPLPATRIGLQEQSRMPDVIKMAVVYERPFWRDADWSGTVITDSGPANYMMDSSPPGGGKGVLAVLLAGANARKAGAMPKRERQRAIVRTIASYFGPRADEPLAIHEKRWREDEWAQGGYGIHYPAGVLPRCGAALAEPVGAIHWAGTEAATEWRTYMEGAVESGQRAAAEAIRGLGKFES